MEENNFLKVIKTVGEGSNKIITWTLSIIGGSLLTLLSTSYLHPESNDLKKFYLLFIIGWILFAISMYYGINISGRSMASDLYYNKPEELKNIFKSVNSDYKCQLKYFKYGLMIFAIWLVLYLLWWIYGNKGFTITNTL